MLRLNDGATVATPAETLRRGADEQPEPKAKGLFRKKVDRNRTQALKYIADSYHVGLGAVRAAAATEEMRLALEHRTIAAGGSRPVTGKLAEWALPEVELIRTTAQVSADVLRAYQKRIDEDRGVRAVTESPTNTPARRRPLGRRARAGPCGPQPCGPLAAISATPEIR